MSSESGDASVSFLEFKMAEDDQYGYYPWGKVDFDKLMNSLRQDLFIEKHLYRLKDMPHILNVRIYVYYSEVDKGIVFRTSNRIPGIFNWCVVTTKAKYDKFMLEKFNKVIFSYV